jgi:tetratricopeptide (TPR) repeat protein
MLRRIIHKAIGALGFVSPKLDSDEAIRLNPQEAKAYYGGGMVYEGLGMTKEAELDYQKAKELGFEP